MVIEVSGVKLGEVYRYAGEWYAYSYFKENWLRTRFLRDKKEFPSSSAAEMALLKSCKVRINPTKQLPANSEELYLKGYKDGYASAMEQK